MAALGDSIKLAAPADCEGRSDCEAGLTNVYGFTIDEYRLSKRVPAGGSTVIEFRADRPGTFSFYSNLSNDSRHSQMRGQLVVRPR